MVNNKKSKNEKSHEETIKKMKKNFKYIEKEK